MVGILVGLHQILLVEETLDLLLMMESYLDKKPHLQMTQLDLKMLWCVYLFLGQFFSCEVSIFLAESSNMMVSLCINIQISFFPVIIPLELFLIKKINIGSF